MGIFGPREPWMIPLFKHKRMLVVLDLDHTLVHTVAHVTEPPALGTSGTFDIVQSDSSLSTVFLRPHISRFIRALTDAGIEYAVWTAGTATYARDVCAGIARFDPTFSPVFVYDRSHTSVVAGRHLKDISSVGSAERVVLVDDDVSHAHFAKRNSHVVVVPKFHHESTDDSVLLVLAEQVSVFFSLGHTQSGP